MRSPYPTELRIDILPGKSLTHIIHTCHKLGCKLTAQPNHSDDFVLIPKTLALVCIGFY